MNDKRKSTYLLSGFLIIYVVVGFLIRREFDVEVNFLPSPILLSSTPTFQIVAELIYESKNRKVR